MPKTLRPGERGFYPLAFLIMALAVFVFVGWTLLAIALLVHLSHSGWMWALIGLLVILFRPHITVKR